MLSQMLWHLAGPDDDTKPLTKSDLKWALATAELLASPQCSFLPSCVDFVQRGLNPGVCQKYLQNVLGSLANATYFIQLLGSVRAAGAGAAGRAAAAAIKGRLAGDLPATLQRLWTRLGAAAPPDPDGQGQVLEEGARGAMMTHVENCMEHLGVAKPVVQAQPAARAGPAPEQLPDPQPQEVPQPQQLPQAQPAKKQKRKQQQPQQGQEQQRASKRGRGQALQQQQQQQVNVGPQPPAQQVQQGIIKPEPALASPAPSPPGPHTALAACIACVTGRLREWTAHARGWCGCQWRHWRCGAAGCGSSAPASCCCL